MLFKRILPFMFLLVLIPTVGFSSENKVDEKLVRKIAYELRCPVCQGLSVKESEAGISVNMKNKIIELLKEGKSEEEIYQYFELRYGEWIRRTPKKEGFNLLVWIAPFAVILGGLFIVLFISKKNSRKTALTDDAPLTAEEQKALDQKIKQLQREKE